MSNSSRWSIGKTILVAGLIAGTIDITDAIVVTHFRGGSPMRMLRFIASGLHGPDVVQSGGTPMSALGLLFHYCIAAGWATLYVLASTRIAALLRRPVVCGLIYGGFVWVMMNYVVLPFSRVRPGPGFQMNWILFNSVGIILLGVGLPIALIAARGRRG